MEKWNKGWTLFLDRDGVINQRIPGAYVEYPSQFTFSENGLEAMLIFNKIFGRTVIVTNQQGIGKGIMTKEQLDAVHAFMKNAIEKAGGYIDKIYYCPELAKLDPQCRKPKSGMALQAKKDFPEIEFSKSVMVGDSNSDMDFGKRLNMTTIFIEGKNDEIPDNDLIDFKFSSLFDFALSI